MGNQTSSNPQQVLSGYLDRYNHPDFQQALVRLEADRTHWEQQHVHQHPSNNGNENNNNNDNCSHSTTEAWAQDLYQTFCDFPSDERCLQSNQDRKTILTLVYDMVVAWQALPLPDQRQAMAQAILDTFKLYRLTRMLVLVVAMDRAQALWKMRYGNITGMPWVSKRHLLPDTDYAREYPFEQTMWQQKVEQSYQPHPNFQPPMSGKLFLLLFDPTMQLRRDPELAAWARPYELPPDVHEAWQAPRSPSSVPRTVQLPNNMSSTDTTRGGSSTDRLVANMIYSGPPVMSIGTVPSWDDSTSKESLVTTSHMEYYMKEMMQKFQKEREKERQEERQKSFRQKHEQPPRDQAAIIFTDVQGSTRLWESNAQVMNEALQKHDTILRLALARHGGYEIKTEGDAFHASFHTAAHAVNFCLQAQLELYQADWSHDLLQLEDAQQEPGFCGLRVRMAMDFGAVESQTNPVTKRLEYTGPAVNMAKSLEAMAHGGQILVSGRAWNAASYQVEHVQVLDLGCHVLRLGHKSHDDDDDDTLVTCSVLQLVPSQVAHDHTFVMDPDKQMSYEPTRNGRCFPPVLTLKQLTPSYHDAPNARGHVAMLFVYNSELQKVLEDPARNININSSSNNKETKSVVMSRVAQTIGQLVGRGPGYQAKDFMCAFSSAAQAVQFGLDLLLELEHDNDNNKNDGSNDSDNKNDKTNNDNIPLSKLLQVGIHYGAFTKLEPNAKSGRADYFGKVVNRAARVASVTPPGMVYLGGMPEEDQPKVPAALEWVETRDLKGVGAMSLYQCRRRGASEEEVV